VSEVATLTFTATSVSLQVPKPPYLSKGTDSSHAVPGVESISMPFNAVGKVSTDGLRSPCVAASRSSLPIDVTRTTFLPRFRMETWLSMDPSGRTRLAHDTSTAGFRSDTYPLMCKLVTFFPAKGLTGGSESSCARR